MTDRIQEQVTHLLKDDSRPARDRVDDLLKLREDARALQRAATESPMATGEDAGEDVGAGLRQIDRALEKLGHSDPGKADENSAATL